MSDKYAYVAGPVIALIRAGVEALAGYYLKISGWLGLCTGCIVWNRWLHGKDKFGKMDGLYFG